MFHSATFLSLILAMLSAVDASPLSRRTGKTTLSFACKLNGDGNVNLVEKDQARAQAIALASQNGPGKNGASFSIANAGIIYTAEVGVGDPVTNYTLGIDTGSSNTFVGANKSYVPTKNSKDTGNTIAVAYGTGSFSGEEWLDTVTLAPGLVINQQSIGVVNMSNGFEGFDGLLGVGPVDLTVNTVSNTNTVPTVTDNLHSQGTISQEVLGVYFVPVSESGGTGELTFGGVDTSVITSGVNYVPFTKTQPAAMFWGIDQLIKYGDSPIVSGSGVVDTGSTLILLAQDAFQKYQSATGGVMDEATGMLSITPAQYDNLKPLSFHIGSETYDLSPNAQIWPRVLNTAIGGNATGIYLIVNVLPSGFPFEFINGYAFLEHYYSVFDTTHGRVGFARTAYTDSTSN